MNPEPLWRKVLGHILSVLYDIFVRNSRYNNKPPGGN